MNRWAMHSPMKRDSIGLRAAIVALGAMLGFVSPTAVWAQGLDDLGTKTRATGRQAGAAEKPALPAPAAVPGAKARDQAAPATRMASDMQPTEALFDAINRGDIAAARDSLNRGADLGGVNILGMTPMELSVDLGRNDISFLLLSMRGEDSGRGARAVGRDTTQAVASAKPGQPPKAVAVVKHGAPANAAVAAKPVATPRLFANDGGRPQPNAGFLGFDSRSTTN